MKNTRLLAEQHTIVLSMWELGHSQARIAAALGVPVGAVRRVIHDKYPNFVGRKFLPVKDIVKRYNAGETMESLSIKYNTTIHTIKSRLEGEGIEIRTQSEWQRTHTFNEHFFDTIDTEPKAYWLGYLFADGNVSARMLDVSVSIKLSDTEHLNKFLADIDHSDTKPIMTLSGNGFTPNYTYSRLSLRSQTMAYDLAGHGCVPNKSFDVSAPIGLPRELESHFIRGVIDGDGYIGNHSIPALEIVGSHELMSWIASRLRLGDPRPHKSIWRIRTSGKRAVEIIDALYSNAGVYLDRKKELTNKLCQI